MKEAKSVWGGVGGFTLLEILLVVAIIAILAGIVIVAINPAKQLGDARNAQRRADVNTILSAVYQFVIDNNGHLPSNIATTSLAFTTGTTTCANAAVITTANKLCKYGAASCGGVSLDTDLVTGDQAYVTSIPTDPSTLTSELNYTGYYITKLYPSNRVLICAPSTENVAASTTVDGAINVSR